MQYISALRYFLATDEFVNQNKHPCDSKVGYQKDLFRKYVAHVVNLDGISYTANFRKTINFHESDLCAVGSNFFSVNVVKDSLVDPKAIFSFPRRKKGSELLQVANGMIAIHACGYDSFASLFSGKSICAYSLCLWLVRNETINESNDLSESVLSILRNRYSKQVVDILCPSQSAFRAFISTLKQPLLVSKKEVISKEDILVDVKPKQPNKPLLSDIRDKLSFALRVFRAARGEDKWQTCRDGYKDLNVGMREYYDVVTADEILNFDSEAFKDFCCNRTWMGRNGSGFAAISQAIESAGGCDAHQQFFAALKTRPKFPSDYWDGERPGGVGHALISELLMKFHPSDYAMYNSKTHDALTFLGLIEGRFESDFTADQYSRVLGIQAMIRQKMKEMKIQSRLEEESPDADFLTVNEFLYYVATNQQFVKEEMMKEQLKPVTRVKRQGERDLNSSDELMIRLMSALRTKPFAILAGHSGTGKSRMVRRLAYMTCRDERLLNGDTPGNFCMVQVKPNWHDSTDLLGYYSALEQKYKPTDFLKFICKAYAYPDVPFFVCLDEMNLAPVEQYFAECLSAMETGKMKNGEFVTDSLISRDIDATDLELKFTESKTWLDDHGLTIPRNLFVVGTVNMDETTCQFSRKVLDRAMTIEMNEIKFEDFGKKNDEPGEDDLLKDEKINTLLNGKTKAAALSERQIDLLNKLKDVLESTPFVVAYRFANEYALYAEALKEFGGKDESAAFDHAVLMKVLPRIAGEYDAVKGIFEGDPKGATGKKKMGLMSLFLEGGSNGNQSRSLSCAKMREILARNESYLSFWP